MRLDIYLNYPGHCEEAFRFYERRLNGKVTSIKRHEDVPNPEIPAEWKEKVLHARMEIGSTVVMAADIPNAQPMRSAYLTLMLDEEAEAERIYALLAEGGEIFMPL
ncbi:MAG: VOC family protein, partial [Thermoanaerobaculia bacterium]